MQLTKKCLIPIENSESTFHYVLSMHDIDKILEKKQQYFPDIDFVREGYNEYYQDKCWQKKNQKCKYYAKNSKKICKMQKVHYEKNDMIFRKRSICNN